MTTPIIPRWAILTDEARADAVIDWCQERGIDTSSILGYQLAAAMAEANKTIEEDDGISYEPSPVDYVRLVQVLAAFLRSRI